MTDVGSKAAAYESEDFVFEPWHYLALLEHKTNALDQAASLVGWQKQEEFTKLRRLLESPYGQARQARVRQVLRSMESFRGD
jgi:hypothetical protein